MHRAPVVGLAVLDGRGSPLPEPLEVAHDLARSPDMQGTHHLLVVSEEQFKVDAHTHTHLDMCIHTSNMCTHAYTHTHTHRRTYTHTLHTETRTYCIYTNCTLHICI